MSTSRRFSLLGEYELIEGNPSFIEEILKLLLLTGTIVSERVMWERQFPKQLYIPNSVQDAVQLRLEQVSSAARQVVMLADASIFSLLQSITQQEDQELLSLCK